MFQIAEETRPRAQLARLTLERLRRTLGLVGTNPRYRARLGGVEPPDIRTLEDWARLPFLGKDELRDAYPFGLTCAGRGNVMRVQMSSGSTGRPILNPYTRADVAQWTEVMARSYAAAGVTSRDVVQITPSFGVFTGGFGFHYGAERLGAMVVPVGAGRTAFQLELMRELGTTVVAAIATYPLRLIEVAREERIDLGALRLRTAILGAEMWSDDLRALIERELGVETFDIIGMTETGGPGLGIDCRAHDGIHVWEDHYYCEIVDPATGAPLPDGHDGELVISTLTREGLPLVRYRTRDLTRIVSREPCACGRTHLRVDRLRGRTDDMVIFRGVNFYPRQIESLLVGRPGVGHEYQIELDRGAGGDRMTVRFEVRPGFDPAELRGLARDLKDFLALSPELCPVGEGDLPRAAGKAVRVVDRRGP